MEGDWSDSSDIAAFLMLFFNCYRINNNRIGLGFCFYLSVFLARSEIELFMNIRQHYDFV